MRIGRVNNTNASILLKTCRADGVLLRTDKPATAIGNEFLHSCNPCVLPLVLKLVRLNDVIRFCVVTDRMFLRREAPSSVPGELWHTYTDIATDTSLKLRFH